MAEDPTFVYSPDKKIQAIKEVRARTGLGLKESKEAVDGGGSWNDIMWRAQQDPNYRGIRLIDRTPDFVPINMERPQTLRGAMRQRADLAVTRGDYISAIEMYRLLLDFPEGEIRDYEV